MDSITSRRQRRQGERQYNGSRLSPTQKVQHGSGEQAVSRWYGNVLAYVCADEYAKRNQITADQGFGPAGRNANRVQFFWCIGDAQVAPNGAALLCQSGHIHCS